MGISVEFIGRGLESRLGEQVSRSGDRSVQEALGKIDKDNLVLKTRLQDAQAITAQAKSALDSMSTDWHEYSDWYNIHNNTIGQVSTSLNALGSVLREPTSAEEGTVMLGGQPAAENLVLRTRYQDARDVVAQGKAALDAQPSGWHEYADWYNIHNNTIGQLRVAVDSLQNILNKVK